MATAGSSALYAEFVEEEEEAGKDWMGEEMKE